MAFDLLGLAVTLLIGALAYILGRLIERSKWRHSMPDMIKAQRSDAVKKSRSVIGGQFSEQLSPYLPDFSFKPTEVKFIGSPIDFIVFEGMDQKDIQKVIFVEVKSGSSQLSPQEKKLKEAILKKNVEWSEYRVPEDLTSS